MWRNKNTGWNKTWMRHTPHPTGYKRTITAAFVPLSHKWWRLIGISVTNIMSTAVTTILLWLSAGSRHTIGPISLGTPCSVTSNTTIRHCKHRFNTTTSRWPTTTRCGYIQYECAVSLLALRAISHWREYSRKKS